MFLKDDKTIETRSGIKFYLFPCFIQLFFIAISLAVIVYGVCKITDITLAEYFDMVLAEKDETIHYIKECLLTHKDLKLLTASEKDQEIVVLFYLAEIFFAIFCASIPLIIFEVGTYFSFMKKVITKVLELGKDIAVIVLLFFFPLIFLYFLPIIILLTLSSYIYPAIFLIEFTIRLINSIVHNSKVILKRV